MKKKILGVALTVALLVTSSVSAVYAEKYGNGKFSGAVEEKSTAAQEKQENKGQEKKKGLEELRGKLEEVHKDKAARKELIREIVEQRKQNNDDSIPVFINGKELKSDVPPVIKYGRILIPVRAVTNALGADVQWNPDTATATITKTVYGSVYGSTYEASTIKIELKLDEKIAFVNGKQVELDVKAETINNRMLVPIRFIAETFKNYVEWDEETGSAIIEDEDKVTETPAPQTPTTAPTPAPTPTASASPQ